MDANEYTQHPQPIAKDPEEARLAIRRWQLASESADILASFVRNSNPSCYDDYRREWIRLCDQRDGLYYRAFGLFPPHLW